MAQATEPKVSGRRPLRTYYIGPDGQTINKTEEDRIVEEIQRNGYSIIKYNVDEEELEYLRNSLENIYKIQMDEAREANPGCPEYDDDHAQVLLAYDKHFLDMAMNPDVLNIVRRFVGEYFIVRWQTGIINRPNIQDDATAWHRDLVHQHYISTPPLSISALYCLDDFSPETGGTQILTGSHLHEKFPSKEYEEKFTDTVTAPAGSIVVFDAMMFHRAGLNTSSNLRRAVSHVYTVPIFKSPVSIPKMLKDKYKDDPQLREILGYNSEMVDDVSEWRRREYLKDAYSE